MNNEYLKIFRDLDKIRKQLDTGKKQYSYKKHIEAKKRKTKDIYATKKDKTYYNDSEYVFLLDNSGSMRNYLRQESIRKTDFQADLVIEIISCLEQLKKNFGVYGFSSDYNESNLYGAIHNVFVPFEKKTNVFKKLNKQQLRKNIMGVSYQAQVECVNLQIIYDEILQNKKKYKKSNRVNIIMFSDGGIISHERLMRVVVNNITAKSKKTNIYLYIFNIDHNDNDVYGKISSVIHSVYDVPREFKKLIKKGEQYD